MNFKNTVELRIFADVWNLFKRYYVVSDNDDFWESVIKDADVLYKKYDGSRFAKSLIVAVLGELELRVKEGMKNADTQ